MQEYHVPVMLHECIEGLNLKPDGVYVDVTFGGGGHSKEILKHLNPTGKLFAFDQDPEALENAKDFPENFQLIQANFRHMQRYLRLYGVQEVDGILADLGISSHQIDTPERGFSTRFEGDLDMRMGPNLPKTAAQLLAEASEKQLVHWLSAYGEVRNAKTLARALVQRRINAPLKTSGELRELCLPLAPRQKQSRYLAQVFQAIRIAVNDEMGALEDMLAQSIELLKPKGRLVLLSYHSLEDRLAKNFIRAGNPKGQEEKDFYGKSLAPLKAITRKAETATPDEIAQNNRARSAKLRIGEKK